MEEKIEVLAFLFNNVTGTNEYGSRRLIQFQIKEKDGKYKRISLTAEGIAQRYESIKQWSNLDAR